MTERRMVDEARAHWEPSPDAALELGLAWQEAEAALPTGWGIGIEPSNLGYQAGAGRNEWTVWATEFYATPAAALRALAVKLREEAHRA